MILGRPVYRILRRGGGRPNFRCQDPQFSKFPQNHKGPPLCENRDLKFRGGGHGPLYTDLILGELTLHPPPPQSWSEGGGFLKRIRRKKTEGTLRDYEEKFRSPTKRPERQQLELSCTQGQGRSPGFGFGGGGSSSNVLLTSSHFTAGGGSRKFPGGPLWLGTDF